MEIDRDLAMQYLGDCLFGAILGQAGAVRPSDLVRSLPSGMRLSVALIRRCLEEDDRFDEVAGRFDIADSIGIDNRPFGGAVTTLLEQYERPMSISLMITALTRIRGGSLEYFRDLLDKFEASRDDIVYAAEHVFHSDWVLQMAGDDEEQMLFYNRLDDDEELREMWEDCEESDLRKRDPGLTALNILDEFEQPLPHRHLAFLTCLHHPQIFEPVDFLKEILQRDDVIPACGMWFSEQMVGALHEELQKASDEVEGEAEEAIRVDLKEVLDQEPPSTPYKLESDDRTEILSIVSTSQVPIGIDELIGDILGVDPDSKRFIGAAHTLEEELSREEDLIELSPGRYLSRSAIPEWVHEVPEPLMPVETDADTDVLIELDVLPDHLQEEVRDPIYEDIASDVEVEMTEDLAAEDSIDYPLLHHHYVMGTVAIRSIDQPFFEGEPELSLLVMRYEDSEVYPVWLNTKLGLLFGLARWYQRHLPPSGGIFRIKRADAPETFIIEYDGDTEDELAPGEERMVVLEKKRERVSRRPISVRDLMVELLEEHEDGLTFNELWAEMNVVRRTSRWQIASLLAYHTCFSEDAERWSADRALMGEPGDEDLGEFIIRPEEEEEGEEDEDTGEEDGEDTEGEEAEDDEDDEEDDDQTDAE